MPSRRCVVPNCLYQSKRKSNTERRSMFTCPKDKNKALKWISSIPGVSHLDKYDTVCERHFHPKFIKRCFDKHTNHLRSRLSNDAVPTIFTNFDELDNNISVPFFLANCSINEIFQTEDIINENNLGNKQLYTNSVEASLKDVVKDLTDSEQLLATIKTETFLEDQTTAVKTENSEDCLKNELTIYDQLENNLSYYSTLLPESWSISQFFIDNNKVFAFSKECAVSENQALVVMYEKNIVLNQNGETHYSIHGKKLNKDYPCTPSVVKDIESLLDILLKFNEVKVCQGIYTNEFEVDKDCTIYKDDIGYCRHNNCTLITDMEQCDICFKYSQYLISTTLTSIPVLNNRAVYL